MIEVTRLLTPELRTLEGQLQKNVASGFQGDVKGTWALEVPPEVLGQLDLRGQAAQQVVTEITGILTAGGRSPGRHVLDNGFVLWQAREDGAKIVPLVTMRGLPAEADGRSKQGRALRNELGRILREAHCKFQGYAEHRILLVDVSQSGLDVDFHAGFSKSGPGILRKWCSALLTRRTNIDHVCLEPGIRVFRGITNLLATGHKYVDTPGGYYREVWTRTDLTKL
ncbi:MAG: hypothetical protein ISS55_04805 [Dehalococcoidales bacterium]|nr:hypothetical protein [Dehalococcoidales bacterium]